MTKNINPRPRNPRQSSSKYAKFKAAAFRKQVTTLVSGDRSVSEHSLLSSTETICILPHQAEKNRATLCDSCSYMESVKN